jgi:lysophospholipase L1-like esterase
MEQINCMFKFNRACRYIWLFCLLAWFAGLTRLEGQTNLAVVKWRSELAAFAESDRTNPPPHGAILFLGSSSFRKWTTMAQDFPGKQVINRGFGGSEVADSVALVDQLVFPYEPRMIVFYAGDNDLAFGKSPEQVVADYRAFVDKVHARLPKTVIAYLSIKPSLLRWRLRDEIMAVNREIKAMPDKELRFIDIYPLMLGADGKPKRELFLMDGLHPSAKCYQMWAGVIKPYLDF